MRQLGGPGGILLALFHSSSIIWQLACMLKLCRVCPYYTDSLSINDLYHVNVHLIEMVHLWWKFGLALGLKPLTLERIKSNSSPKDAESSFTEMLATWLKGEDRPCDDFSLNWGEVIASVSGEEGIC